MTRRRRTDELLAAYELSRIQVRGERHDAPTCPTHARPLICPACVGARGGKVGGKALTPAKLRQLRRASKRPRPGARKLEVDA